MNIGTFNAFAAESIAAMLKAYATAPPILVYISVLSIDLKASKITLGSSVSSPTNFLAFAVNNSNAFLELSLGKL